MTLFMTMLAAFEVLLARYTGQEDLLVGSVTGGRKRPEIERLLGYFLIERVRPDLAAWTAPALAPSEVAAVEALAPEARVSAFFRLWTLKEAYVKARGDGVGLGLDRFAVPLEGGRPTLLGAEDDGRSWWLTPLDAGPWWAAAVATAGGAPRVRLSHWP